MSVLVVDLGCAFFAVRRFWRVVNLPALCTVAAGVYTTIVCDFWLFTITTTTGDKWSRLWYVPRGISSPVFTQNNFREAV